MPDSTVIAHGAPEAAHDEHPSYLRHHFNSVEQQADASNFAMWLFLLTEVMFFGGLFTAYLIYRNWYYASFVAASHQTWSANLFTTVSDMFPKKTVASVTGFDVLPSASTRGANVVHALVSAIG